MANLGQCRHNNTHTHMYVSGDRESLVAAAVRCCFVMPMLLLLQQLLLLLLLYVQQQCGLVSKIIFQAPDASCKHKALLWCVCTAWRKGREKGFWQFFLQQGISSPRMGCRDDDFRGLCEIRNFCDNVTMGLLPHGLQMVVLSGTQLGPLMYIRTDLQSCLLPFLSLRCSSSSANDKPGPVFFT